MQKMKIPLIQCRKLFSLPLLLAKVNQGRFLWLANSLI